MLILAIVVFGLAVGWVAQLLLGRGSNVQWGLALFAGLAGSFVGGLIASLLSGDGFDIQPSGIIGSIVGAVVVTAIALWAQGRSKVT